MTVTTLPAASATPRVDANVLRTNQVTIVAVVAVAFVIGAGAGAWLIALLALSMAIGAARPGFGPIQLFYRRVLTPSGLVKPSPREESPAPHRFAQALGAAFLFASALLLLAGVTTFGWLLGGVVVALALTNLVFGFCAGCFVFLQLRRAGLLP